MLADGGKATPATETELDPDIAELMLLVARLQRESKKVVRQLSREYNLSDRGLHILGSVRSGFDRPAKLIEYFQILPSTATFETDKLVTAGLMTREADPSDRRGVVLRLTPEGTKVYSETAGRINALLEPGLSRLDTSERAQFLALFHRILAP